MLQRLLAAIARLLISLAARYEGVTRGSDSSNSAIAEQQRAEHQQTTRATCQARICCELLAFVVIACHIGHVLEALLLVGDFITVADNPACTRAIKRFGK